MGACQSAVFRLSSQTSDQLPEVLPFFNPAHDKLPISAEGRVLTNYQVQNMAKDVLVTHILTQEAAILAFSLLIALSAYV
jgi:hypothetical protein